MEKGIITLDCVRYESNFEQGEQVGTLHLYDKTFKLYQNEEIGLQFIDNGETQNLLTMINEEDYKTVIDEIINHLFKDISPQKFKVHVISTSSNK